MIVLPLLAISVVTMHVLPGLDGSFAEANIRDALHVLGFAGVAAILFEVVPASPVRKSLSAFAVAVLLGALSESIQRYVNQPFNFADVLRDAAGAAIYLLARLIWHWSGSKTNSPVLRNMLRGSSALIVALLIVPLIYWSSVIAQYVRRLPVIVDFTAIHDVSTIKPINARIQVADNGTASVEMFDPGWSGILVDAVAGDWSGYRYLVVYAGISGARGGKISVHLSDGPHAGVRTQHSIGSLPAADEIAELRFELRDVAVLPGRPELNIARIELLYLIGQFRGEGAILTVDQIRLE